MTDIREFTEEQLRGCLYIVRGGETICEYCGGYADLANRRPNTMETRFESASAGKAFVAAGILRLKEQGALSLEDTLGGLLGDSIGAIDPDVTVEMLLDHTSGVPDYFDESVMDDYGELWRDVPNYSIRRNDDMLPLFIDRPMMYPKGTRFQYNNSGYVLLAKIIEKLTLMPFDEYLKKEVFGPCGMERTGYFGFDRLPEGCASCYIYCPETGGFRTNIYSVEANGSGAGGAYVTVKDVVRFWNGLLGGKLLSKSTVSRMMSVRSGDGVDPEEGYYGWGLWIIKGPDGNDIPYFQGCDDGATFISEYHPASGTITVITSNFGDNVWKIMRSVRQKLY